MLYISVLKLGFLAGRGGRATGRREREYITLIQEGHRFTHTRTGQGFTCGNTTERRGMMYERLVEAIVNMREAEAMSCAKELLDKGENPLKIMEQCREAVEIVGAQFEKGEYFLPELMMAGHMLAEISNMVKPVLSKGLEVKRIGKVLIGTVEGDVHDIGKNIVTFLLDANGFEVMDIGIDVPPEKFVSAIKDFSPQVVGLSGLLTIAFDSMKKTVQAIEKAGLRSKVKIMIGGGQTNEKIKEYAEADAYGKDAMAGVLLAKQWVGEK